MSDILSSKLSARSPYNMLVPCLSYAGAWPFVFSEATGGRLFATCQEGKIYNGGNVISPGSLSGTKTSPKSFGLAYLTPNVSWRRAHNPIDGPSDLDLLNAVTPLMAVGGILLAALDPKTFESPTLLARNVRINYENVRAFQIGESAYCTYLIGSKRKSPDVFEAARHLVQVESHESVGVYAIPGQALPPKYFDKESFTTIELLEASRASPLRSIFKKAREVIKPRPPLELGIGHIAAMIASGQFDGLIEAEGFEPHVVKGMTRKDKYIKDLMEYEDSSTTVIESDRVVPLVRAVFPNGTIETYQ